MSFYKEKLSYWIADVYKNESKNENQRFNPIYQNFHEMENSASLRLLAEAQKPTEYLSGQPDPAIIEEPRSSAPRNLRSKYYFKGARLPRSRTSGNRVYELGGANARAGFKMSRKILAPDHKINYNTHNYNALQSSVANSGFISSKESGEETKQSNTAWLEITESFIENFLIELLVIIPNQVHELLSIKDKTSVLDLIKHRTMKNRIVSLLLAFLAIAGINAQNDCSNFYPLKEGTKFQITSYDKKDKLQTVMDYTVKSFTGDAATMAYEMYDEKGEMLVTSEYDMTCTSDGISIDFKSLVAPGVFEQYKDMEVDMTGTNLLLPNKLSAGQSLPDADMLMTVKIEPISMKLNARVFNRKVEGKETITTPAGTFDCYVITYDHESKFGIKISGSAKQWLAEGVGLVSQADYDKKGRITSKSVLTKLEK